MKTTTDYYDKLNESGERLYTSFRLVKSDGTTHEISNRVRDHSDLDEDVEDETLNVGGGDMVFVLDNRDRFFAGDHEGGGLFDEMNWGTWQAFVVRGHQKSTDELGAFRGIVAPGFERLDNGYRVKIVALSFASYAKKISAWDGTDEGRLVFNQPIATLVDEMLSRLDPNGVYPGEPGSTLDSDIQLPLLPGSDRFYQAFDSTLEPTGRNKQGLIDGPRKLYWVQTVGDEEFFILDSKSSTNAVSWGMAYDRTTGVWRMLSFEYFSSYSQGTATEPLYEGLADTVSGRLRYWFVKPDWISIWTTSAAGKPQTSIIDTTPTFRHTHENPMAFSTSESPWEGTYLNYVEWETRGNYTIAHLRAYYLDQAGTRHELAKLAVAPDVNLITPGYRYLGADGIALQVNGAVVHPDRNRVLVFTNNSVFCHDIAANTTVRVTQSTTRGSNQGWVLRNYGSDEDNPPRRWFTRFHYVRAGDWWGMIGWRRGSFSTEAGGDEGMAVRGVLVDNESGGHPSYSEWIDDSEWNDGFGPEDGIGLLPADHPDNPTDKDERIEHLDEARIDVHLTGGNLTRFSTLWQEQGLGVGNRSYTIREPLGGLPHVPGDLPPFTQDYRTALVTSDYDFARGGVGVCGERLDGAGGGLPSEFFIQAIAQGPGGSPVDENRRITFLTRTAITVPVVHQAELVDQTAWTVITKALQAANSSGVFRWDEASGRQVFYVRGRTRRDAHQLIQEEYDFALAETERIWEHVYDGVSIEGGLGQKVTAGDVTSPNSRVLPVVNDFISPSLIESLATDYHAFFSVTRRVFKLQQRDRPHWELLDFLKIYLLNDQRTYQGRMMSRRIRFDRDEADLFLVEDLP